MVGVVGSSPIAPTNICSLPRECPLTSGHFCGNLGKRTERKAASCLRFGLTTKARATRPSEAMRRCEFQAKPTTVRLHMSRIGSWNQLRSPPPPGTSCTSTTVGAKPWRCAWSAGGSGAGGAWHGRRLSVNVGFAAARRRDTDDSFGSCRVGRPCRRAEGEGNWSRPLQLLRAQLETAWPATIARHAA
jgi:hypothetical protein